MTAVPARRFVLLTIVAAGCGDAFGPPASSHAPRADELAALSATSVASGRQPDIVEFSEVFTDRVSCGAFDILFEATYDFQIRTYFDRAGNPTRQALRITVRGTATNSETGKTIEDNADFTNFIDLATGVQAVTGVKFRWRVPGEGLVVLDAGQISFNPDGSVIFIRGPHDTFEQGAGVFCAALD